MNQPSSRRVTRARVSGSLPSAAEVDAALDPLDPEPQFLEDDPPPPAPRRRPRAASEPRLRHGQANSDEGDLPQQGSRFLLRFLVALLAALGLCVAQVLVAQDAFRSAWVGLVTDGSPSLQAYVMLAVLVLGAALIIAVIAALHDRSVWRVWQLGLAWATLAILVVTYVTLQHPAAAPADSDVTLGLAMSQVLVAPSLSAWQQNNESLADLRQEHRQQDGLRAAREQDLEQALEESRSLAQTTQAELTATRSLLQDSEQEQATLTQHVAQVQARVTALEAEGAQALARVHEMTGELQRMGAERDRLLAESARLREQVALLRRQQAAATEEESVEVPPP